MHNLQNILNLTTGYFEKNGIDSPRLSAELLLCHAFSMNRMQLYINWERPVNDTELATVREMLKKRVSGIPIQYITGEAFFYGRKFFVSPHCLIPRPETEELLETVIAGTGKSAEVSILDIGTGSGNIPVTLALELPLSKIVTVDISNEATETARRNCETYNLNDRITFVQASVFDTVALTAAGKFNVFVSNPPYIPAEIYEELEKEVKENEPKIALTDSGDGLSFYRRFAELAPVVLYPDGMIYLEIHAGMGDAVSEIFSDDCFTDKTVKKDISGNERIFSCRYKGGV